MPTAVLAARIAKRLGVDGPWSRRMDFLHMPDTARPMKAPSILFNSMIEVGLDPGMLVDRMSNGVIAEVGCGKHIGFAPLALTLGARQYIGIDPGLDEATLKHPLVQKRYFDPALAAAQTYLSEQFSEHEGTPKIYPVASVEPFEKISLKRTGVSDAGIENETVDLCVSVSCLEHITDFDAAARAMARMSHPETIHVHLVNFSSHLSKADPFLQLYDQPFTEFSKVWKNNVNGLRLPDLEKTFANADLPLTGVVLDKDYGYLPGAIDPSWLESYDKDVLAVRTAILSNL